jgi:hypothetical protein
LSSSSNVSPNKKEIANNYLFDNAKQGPLIHSEEKARRASKTSLIKPASTEDVNKALDGF